MIRNVSEQRIEHIRHSSIAARSRARVRAENQPTTPPATTRTARGQIPPCTAHNGSVEPCRRPLPTGGGGHRAGGSQPCLASQSSRQTGQHQRWAFPAHAGIDLADRADGRAGDAGTGLPLKV
jgi:hypothetical protein